MDADALLRIAVALDRAGGARAEFDGLVAELRRLASGYGPVVAGAVFRGLSAHLSPARDERAPRHVSGPTAEVARSVLRELGVETVTPVPDPSPRAHVFEVNTSGEIV